MATDVFAGLTVPCCMGSDGCICGSSERVLRGYISGTSLPQMSEKQREWCLEEIGSVEGFDRADYAELTDADLARGVLNAWLEYCRDKGMV